MATTTAADEVLQELAGVIWRLWQAADQAFVAGGPGGDLELDWLAIDARHAACEGAALLGEHRHLCDVEASTARDPAHLVREAEQILAAHSIEHWPAGTSSLIADICDLVREHSL